jgi:DNA (cytosine-5)-methyltransferase 1
MVEYSCENNADKINAVEDKLNNKKMMVENEELIYQRPTSAMEQIKYIDLCSGIGGFRTALESIDKINPRCVLSSDIKQDAIDTYNLNFNENNKTTDIYRLKNEEIESFDLLCAGFPCFIEGTLTLTNNGYKNIEDVVITDRLLTHTGKFQKIKNLQSKIYTGSVFDIKIMYHPDLITTTEEHPFYVREKHANNIFGKAIWKKANELTMHDYFGMIINNNGIIPEFTFEKQYIKLDKLDDWFDMGYLVGAKDEDIPINNIIPNNILKQFARGKSIPEWVQDAPTEFIQEFINGYMKADGNETISSNLAYGLQRLYLKLGQQDISSFIEDGYVWYAPYKITMRETTEIPVYNFEVENDNSYIVMNTIVHNCQPFSSAGQKKGFSDKRGGMIFKIIELCQYHKPSYVVLENVYNLMTLEKGDCIKKIQKLFEDIGYMVNFKKLNSCDFGCAQSRERVYIVCALNKTFDFNDIKYQAKIKLSSVIDYSNKQSNINPEFCEKILQLHKESSVFGCKIGDKRGGKSNIHSWDIDYNGKLHKDEMELMNKIMLNRRKKHWAEKKKMVWMDGMPLTYEEITTFYKHDNLRNMLDNLVSKKYLRLEKPKDLIDGKRQYKDELPEGYNICKGKLSFPISKILDPNDISPTLTATDSHKLAVIIDDTIRNLTSTEMKKLCGFPDSFVVPEHVNYGDLFGNMATPPVIKAIFEVLLK